MLPTVVRMGRRADKLSEATDSNAHYTKEQAQHSTRVTDPGFAAGAGMVLIPANPTFSIAERRIL